MLTKLHNLVLCGALLLAASPAFAQTATPAASGNAENPIVRASGGLWGMQFTFGGLGSLATTNEAITVGSFVFTQVGIRRMVNDNIVIPIYFGFGAQVLSPEGQKSLGNIGLRAGGGLEYHFRIWRRISPFVGGNLNIRYTNPTGPNNWTFLLGLAPTAGIEYFWGDRVSFIAQYFLSFNFIFSDQLFIFETGTHTQNTSLQVGAGGQLSVAFYF